MTGKYVHNTHLVNTNMKKINENTKVTLTLGQLKRLVKESRPKDIEYDEEIDMVDEPKKSNKDEKQKSPTTDRAEEIRAKIREIEKERDSWIQQDDEEYKRYQSFEDRAGWTTRAKANKIRDGFFDRMNSFRSFINDCNKRLEALNKELKNLVKEGTAPAVDPVAAIEEDLSDILDKIDAWRTDGSMEHWQYSQLFDLADDALAKLDEVKKPEAVKEDAPEAASSDDEGPADMDAQIADLFDMYRACKVEPKVCNAIKADGEKTNIFLGRGNSVGGIARALRDGRLLKVIGFN